MKHPAPISPSSHRGHAPLRSATALISALLAALAPLGCGSHPESVSAANDSQLAPAPTGPCDEHHREQAVAAATAAARKALGDVKLSAPDAHFLGVLAHPQMPGQPVEAPTYGWNVTFTAVLPAMTTDTGVPARPPQEELVSPGVSASPPPGLAPPAAQLASAAQADAANGIPQTRDLSPPPNQPGTVRPSVPHDTPERAPDAKRTKTIAVFVAIDGAARML